MASLREYAKHLETITEETLNGLLLESVKENEEIITSKNTDQLFQGQLSTGDNLPNYSKASVEIFGKPAGPIRLFDEGDFYRGFFVEADRFPVRIDSKDSKTVLLVEGNTQQIGYGEDIFGLQEQNQEEVNKLYIKETYLSKLRKLLQLR